MDRETLNMISSVDAINKILKAKKIEDVLDPFNLKKEYTTLIKLIHPDVCDLPGADQATIKLNKLKDNYEGGISYQDESGEFKTNGYTAIYNGDKDLLQQSFSNFRTLQAFKDESSVNFQKYLPKEINWKGTELEVEFHQRAVPLSGLKLDQVHVNWVLSRMLEFSSWLNQIGFSHAGINPESIFIVPESHGIQVASFYLLTPLGKKLKGISGKYKNWYSPEVFDHKKAVPSIDLELSKRTGIYLLGDQSGVGIKLKRDSEVNADVLDFMIQHDDDPTATWKKYRKILEKNFEKKFYKLDL